MALFKCRITINTDYFLSTFKRISSGWYR